MVAYGTRLLDRMLQTVEAISNGQGVILVLEWFSSSGSGLLYLG